MGFRGSWKGVTELGGWFCVGATVVHLTVVFCCGAMEKGSVSWVSLLQTTPGLCGSVNGPEMYELLSDSLGLCMGGFVRSRYVCVNGTYILPVVSILPTLHFYIV